tara:strand:- start:1045 stop:1227 length:183 start_codon:yes stop_codon:yes gene_type:complete
MFMSKIKKTPNFKSEAEEREFWENHDSSNYIDWKNAQSVSMANLKPYHSGCQKVYWIVSR